MTKVFYVHYEGDALNVPSYTRRFSLSDNENTTVNDILDSFSYNFNEWNSSFSLLRSTLTFITESGRKIANNRRLSDIVVVDDTNDFCIKGSCEKKTLSSEQTSNNQTQSKSINSRDSNQMENIDEIKARAKEMFNNKQYRHTRVICEAALKNFQSTQNKRISVDMIVFLKYLAEIKLENGNGSSAITYIRKALDIATKQSYSSYDLNIILIRALIVEKEYDDALTVLNSVLLTLANDSSQLESLALKAEVLFELGRVSEAGDTINRCITPPLAPAEGSGTMALSNIPVLVSYAYISMSCQPPLIEQPLSALLKALSVHVDNKKVRLYLAKLLNLGYSADCSRKDMEDGRGVKELFRQVSSRESTAPAYALLSAVCKDHSAMRPCIRLMETALNLQPMNTSYALSLMHAHEVVGDFDAALTVLLHFCERNSTVSVKLPIQINTDDSSSICQAPEMSCADLIRALTDSTAVLDANAKSIYEFRWSGDSTNLYLHAENAALDSAEPLINMNAAVSFARDFVDSELDLLALGFTAVKILFLQGKLSRLPGLFALLEPLRCYSRKQLHETMIRNEHAYYQSIGQILAHRSAVYFQRRQSQAPLEVRPLVDVGTNNQRISGLEKLFVCGDSHCLSSAWSELTVAGKKRLVVPKLVTGVKQWHLRKEGDFYPKANFSCAIDSIPNGSEVMLCPISQHFDALAQCDNGIGCPIIGRDRLSRRNASGSGKVSLTICTLFLAWHVVTWVLHCMT